MLLLYVIVAPQFTRITDNIPVVANNVNKVKLNCTTDSSNPQSTVTWHGDGFSQNGVETQSAGSYGGIVTTSILEFVATREMDGRVVECRASNKLRVDGVKTDVSLDLRCT